MAQIYVSDSTGEFKTPKALYVADSTGTFKSPKGVWVADSTGTFKPAGWPTGPTVVSMVSTLYSSAPWYGASASAVINGAVQVDFYLGDPRAGGTHVYGPLNSTTAPTMYASGIWTMPANAQPPGGTYTWWVKATDSHGNASYAPGNTLTLSNLPQPSITITSLTTSQINFQVGSVFPDQSVSSLPVQYFIEYQDGSMPYTVAGLGSSRTGSKLVTAGSTHHLYPFCTWNGKSTVGGSATTVNVPSSSGPAPGTYYFPATSMAVWQPISGAWRTDALFHGSYGLYATDASGNMTTLFTYSGIASKLSGGTVSSISIQMYRDSGGSGTAQPSTFWTHGYSSRPAGAPSLSNQSVSSTLLSVGQHGAYIPLPVSYGTALLSGSSKGVAWGNVQGTTSGTPNSELNYMTANLNAAAGTLKIVIS